MFDADHPITHHTEDRLNRTTFAKYLARCLLDHTTPESLVVALYGGYGTGKTSLINLMVEEINFAKNNMLETEQPIIIHFNPWNYSGQKNLIGQFFKRIQIAFNHVQNLKQKNRLLTLLNYHGDYLLKENNPPIDMKTEKTFFGHLFSSYKNSSYYFKNVYDLIQIKTEINDLIIAENRKIIIILDNISQLYSDEIRQIFQIIKSIANYANTAYVLAFDKDIVIKALDHEQKESGELLIEKIIQLPFTVPVITQQDIESILSDRLKPLFKEIPEKSWDKEEWIDLYQSALKYFFSSCRDISRYVNILSFSYLRLREVVNPVDFFALTAIEVFLPDIYIKIRDNRDLFTNLLDSVYRLTEEQLALEKKRCDEIIQLSTLIPPHIILHLLMGLFPRLRLIYEPNKPFYYSVTMARQLHRISSQDLFDVYFRLSLQSNQITKHEFDLLFSALNDENALNQVLNQLNQDHRILKFLDQIDAALIQKIEHKDLQHLLNALLDNGDLFPVGEVDFLNLDTPMKIHRIIHNILQRKTESEDRFLLLQNAIAKAEKSIYIIVHELREQEREHRHEEDTFLPIEFRDLPPNHLILLQKLTISRIKEWANSGRLPDHPNFLSILDAWQSWGDLDELQTYIEKLTKEDKGLLTFLTEILKDAIDMAIIQNQKHHDNKKYKALISQYINPKKLKKHARLLFENDYFEKLSERQQLALMIFLDLIKAKTKKIIPKTTV